MATGATLANDGFIRGLSRSSDLRIDKDGQLVGLLLDSCLIEEADGGLDEFDAVESIYFLAIVFHLVGLSVIREVSIDEKVVFEADSSFF